MKPERNYLYCNRHEDYEANPRAKVCGACGDLLLREKPKSRTGINIIAGLAGVLGLFFGVSMIADEIKNSTDIPQRIKNDYVRVSWLSKKEQLEILDSNGNGVIDPAETKKGISYLGNFYVPK